jgi:hypothetical protein
MSSVNSNLATATSTIYGSHGTFMIVRNLENVTVTGIFKLGLILNVQ